jgi:hypothetical protein
MSRIYPDCPDSDPSDRPVVADVLLRQAPDEEEDEEEDEGDGKEDDNDDDKGDDGYSEWAKHDANRRSDLELPVPAQGSPLDFLFAQEKVECCGNRIGALAQLIRQIALADDYVPGWVAVMDVASIDWNLIGECPEFLLISSLCTLISNLIGFQTPSASSCNSDKTSDHGATLPV